MEHIFLRTVSGNIPAYGSGVQQRIKPYESASVFRGGKRAQ